LSFLKQLIQNQRLLPLLLPFSYLPYYLLILLLKT